MDLELLLTQISNINKNYEEIYKFSGERFNIFKLLDLSGDELSHSKFIATLLNQRGMHEKNSKFLELFLECIEINDFSINNVITKTEKFIGKISNDYTSGGKIDISITNDKNERIFIENKIFANDGRNQLLRYSNYNPKYLFYLTLFGDEPSENSIEKDMKDKYRIISYKNHILKWLELCKMESIDSPILRETLTQYIVLIKQLTGQARSKKMQEKILDIILKDVDNVSAAFIISQNFDEIKLQILKNKFVPLMSELEKKLDFNLNISLDNCFQAYWGFSFVKEEWKKYKIDFEFENADLRNLIYGFHGTDIPEDLNNYLRSLNYKKSQSWSLYEYMENYRCWDEEFYRDLYSNEGKNKIFNVFEEKINEMILIVKDKNFEL